MCLDVLRAIERTPDAVDLLAEELGASGPADARLDALVASVVRRLASRDAGDQSQARALTRDLALALQAMLLLRHAPTAVAEAFCASRLRGEGGVFGLLPAGTDTRAIIERAAPVR
jgi:putative acyl-CoA dehydrogenase